MDESLKIQVKHLWEVEHLTMRQIASKLHLSRKTVSKLIQGEKMSKPPKSSLLEPYERLIAEWYKEYPFLQALQVSERLRSYGYQGSYETVKRGTKRFRRKKKEVFLELEFLPGEQAQVDWMEWKLGEVAVFGFVYVLAYSRYAVVHFYPRHTLEFFLDGHIRAFRAIGGVAHRHLYDNLKSVVIRRTPEVQFNPQFLDVARHYGFSIQACTPGRANEKGRVERLIRDCKDALRITKTTRLEDLNAKMDSWVKERNNRVHRTTQRAPAEMLREEKLRPLPQIDARPYRCLTATATKTAFVEFDTNRYSVPTAYAGTACEILALPDAVEILVQGKRVAGHPRIFKKHDKSELPAHREGLLLRTPRYKFQRIYQLMKGLGPELAVFLENAQAEGEDPVQAAYVMFRLLRGISGTVHFFSGEW